MDKELLDLFVNGPLDGLEEKVNTDPIGPNPDAEGCLKTILTALGLGTFFVYIFQYFFR